MAMIKDSGNRREFSTGAVRDIQEGKGRCDLLPLDIANDYISDDVLYSIELFKRKGHYHKLYPAFDIFAKTLYSDNSYANALLDLSIHFEEGARKYGENNWQKGIPTNCYIDSAIRHYLKFIRGDKDEPHDRAFMWNILCCIWTCKNKPELNVYTKGDEK